MHHTLTIQTNQTIGRKVAALLFFALLTALTARITIFYYPVPITLQTLAVILSGLVLGARGGAAAQLSYLGFIALGLPFDAYGVGSAVFFGPTAGYLVGFIPAAYICGWLAERFSAKNWWGNFIAALAGVLVIYAVGAGWLAYLVGWHIAWTKGIIPFILPDFIKAVMAAGLTTNRKLMTTSI